MGADFAVDCGDEGYPGAYFNVKRNFIIIGLTGYTGSGCSTCREILEKRSKIDLPEYESIVDRNVRNCTGDGNLAIAEKAMSHRDARIHKKLAQTWSETTWKRFTSVEISVIIFCFAIHGAICDADVESDKIAKQIKDIVSDDIDIFYNACLLWESGFGNDNETANKILECYGKAKSIYCRFREGNRDFTEIMQNFGDNVRKYGKAFVCDASPDPKNLFVIPEAVRRVIKSAYWIEKRSNDSPHHFVIDAFRNPFEIEYFKWRYSEFYLVGVMRDESDRKKTLDISDVDFKELHKRESGGAFKSSSDKIEDWITSQNVSECLDKADFFIENREDSTRSFPMLRYNLVKLIALAKSPGCIPPTRDERSMQIAMTVKQMSGCISRKVGAVVVNANGYIIGIGWNDPPSGQTPCSLRTARELSSGGDSIVFSDYERSSEFVSHICTQYGNRSHPFCFKEELASYERSQKKKNEFTRAVHAEENAFFQALKFGGEELRGASLYTTSKTCTLCAKKAYQLGIKRIVYIEDYTDIALDQTIRSGDRCISVNRFQGISGSAYFRLFTHLIPEKDFIKLLMMSSFGSA